LFTDTDGLVSKLQAQLAGMGQRTITEDSLISYKNYFPYFLAAALVLLIIELFVSERKKIVPVVARRTNALGTIFITAGFLFPLASPAQTEKALIKKGNEAYEKKEYGNATDNYKKAVEKNQASSTAQYNLGNALYRSQKPDDAVQAYENALSSSTSKDSRAKSFYNKGVVLQNNKKLPECITAYKNALKLDPKDEDARQNLQRALQQLKQQQQKENKEQKKPKEDQKKKKEEKKKEQEKQQPKPQQSKLTKQDAEEKLKALLQQEKNLQDRIRRVNNASSGKPEKDW
jgi:Ca-activated chloride channel family protein